MQKLANFIVNKRKLIEKTFIVIILLSILLIPLVKINYDMTKYLPEGSPSKNGLNVMEEAFGLQGMARLMIEDISLPQAKEMKGRIEKIDGVDMVLWLDGVVDVYEPMEFINQESIKDYYIDESALFNITFIEDDSSPRTHKALNEIKKVAGEKSYLAGSAVENKCVKDTLIKEVAIAMCIAVPVITVILLLTTTSWLEPFLFLLVTGIGIVINLGTNILLKEISFFTFSVAAILQLAISMDYSIFLLHKFTEEKQKGMPETKAMSLAIEKSIVSILASALTTIVGFLALALMKFEIGKDMGLVLAKGITISLICVIFLMPAIILKNSARIEKSSHKAFIPSFEKIAKGIFKGRFILIVLIGLVVVPAYVGQSMNEFLYGNQALSASEGTVVYEDQQAIQKKFGRSNIVLAVVPRESNIKEKDLVKALESLEEVRYAQTLMQVLPEGIPESFVSESIQSKFHSDQYTRYIISLKTAAESPLAFSITEKIEEIVQAYYPNESYVTGVTPSTRDIKEVIEKDYHFVNIISILGIGVILLLTFKSFLLPIILLSVIEAGIFINMSIPYIAGDTMIFMGYLIVTCLQLGATIDYGILVTNNYMLSRRSYDKREAAVCAMTQSSTSILTSGTILTAAGFVVGKVSTVAAVSQMGILIGRGGLLSTLLVLGVLPPVLVVCDGLIQKSIIDREKIIQQFRTLKSGFNKLKPGGDQTPSTPQNLTSGDSTNIPFE